MKFIVIAVAALATLALSSPAQIPTGAAPSKPTPANGSSTTPWRVEGDTVEECWVIESLPFTEAGSTVGFADDYEEMCPYGSNSPDVVYSYTPAEDMCVSISLCNSYYDTKMFVYEDEVVGGVPYACNDDNYNCVDPPVAYTSWLEEVQLYLGHTYYIVVDGYSGDCGDYVLEVEEIYCGPECVIDCVGVPEGEPTCYDGYDDQYNGGCSSLTWSVIEASPDPIDICGTTGVFMYGSLTYRDTDWYLFYPCGGVPITATIESEVPIMLAFIDLRDWCYNPVIWSYVYGAVCEVVSISDYLPEGQFAVFVAPSDWDIDYECGSDYWLNLEGYTEHCDPTPVEATNWGRLKSLYR
jgi:hypothetical protein